jgi:hypothetical protein
MVSVCQKDAGKGEITVGEMLKGYELWVMGYGL